MPGLGDDFVRKDDLVRKVEELTRALFVITEIRSGVRR
jgi:hypothetical protein